MSAPDVLAVSWRQSSLLCWLGGASLSTTRDVREEYGLARGWMRRYASAARSMAKSSPWRRQNVELALSCRDRVAFLRPLLPAGTVETHGLPSNAAALARTGSTP